MAAAGADNSNFVLRWEMDESDPGLKTGKVESKVFEEGGFRWTIKAEKRIDRVDFVDFTLRCDGHESSGWRCESEIQMHPITATGQTSDHIHKVQFYFDENLSIWQHRSRVGWKYLAEKVYDAFEFRIKIIHAEYGVPIVDIAKFNSSNDMSNVVLTIGDQKLHVSKELLSIHSPVFKVMFFGEFIEKEKEAIVIKDVVYEEFLDLLFVIYPGAMDISDRTVLHILKLADRFQVQSVLDKSIKHLVQSKGFDTMKKLLLADQYRFASLKNHCLYSFTSASDLGKQLTSPDYGKLSCEMKAAICDRMAKLGFK